VIRLPRISNFTDFAPLEQHPLVGVRYLSSPRQLGAPDLVVLPGTKNTLGDLRWLRESGLEAAILKLAAAGTPVLEVIGHSGLTDLIVVVTRYFGGTLLGTGGLVRAYSGAVREALKAAVILESFLHWRSLHPGETPPDCVLPQPRTDEP